MWHSHDGLLIIPSHPHCCQHVNPLPPLLHLSYLCHHIIYLCILLLCVLLTLLHTFPEHVLPLAYTLPSPHTVSCQLFLHKESLTWLCYVTISCVRQQNTRLTHYVKTASPPPPLKKMLKPKNLLPVSR
jgi:hypothetical protein